MLAYQSNFPMSSSVSLRLAEVERLRRQRDKLDMLLNRVQRHLLVDLAALRAMRAQESSWWRALDHGEQVSHLRHASAVLGKDAHDFQISAALSVLRRVDTAVIWPAGGGKSHILHMVGACSPGKLILCVFPLVELADEQCDAIHDAFGKFVELRGAVRQTAYVLGGESTEAFGADGNALPADFAARRRATLAGDRGGGLCEEVREHSLLGHLFGLLQMPLGKGAQDMPCFLLVSPEKLLLSLQLLAFLRDVAELELPVDVRSRPDAPAALEVESRLGCLFVDEAHCMHAHGLTFRDNYLLLGLVVRSLRCWQKLLGLPALVCLIATATASPSTVDDILRLLDVELSTCRVMRAPSGSLRAQMTYTTLPVSSAVQRRQVVNELLRQRIGSCGIVYCSSRSACERRATELSSERRAANQEAARSCTAAAAALARTRSHASISWVNGQDGVAFYHAGMTRDDRTDVRLAWDSGGVSIICATIAWGMGMDKPNVRYVVHESVPQSIEALYQEASRAGRDGQHAEHFIMYDLSSWIRSVQLSGGSGITVDAHRLVLSQKLAILRSYLDPDTCRHQLFEGALGDGTAFESCTCAAANVPASQCCSICSGSATDSEWVAAEDWITDLLRVQTALELQEAPRSPGLLSVLRAWRYDRKDSMPPWKCDALLAHALMAGVYSLHLVACERVHRDLELEESQGRGRMRWELAAMIAPSGTVLALTSSDLVLICLHRPSLDPSVKSARLASAARGEAARRRQVATKPEGSDTVVVDDYTGQGAEDQEDKDSEYEDRYWSEVGWSAFMQDDDAAASDAISFAPSDDDEQWLGSLDQEPSESDSDQEESTCTVPRL